MKPTPARPTAKPPFKAQLRWSPTTPPFGIAFVSYPKRNPGTVHPYWALPATPAAYEAQVEAMANAINNYERMDDDEESDDAWYGWKEEAIVALAAIGITAPPKGRK